MEFLGDGKQIVDGLRQVLFAEYWEAGDASAVDGVLERWAVSEIKGRLPALKKLLEADLQAALRVDPVATDAREVVWAYPGFYALTAYRLAHELYAAGVALLPRLMTEYAHSRTGIDIHPGARIGAGCFIDHGTGVVIGQTAEIGRNVTLYQGVTLGAFSTPRPGKRHPTLEDEVTVYANATILGGDTVIGWGSVVGANAFITASVAPGTRVRPGGPGLWYRSK